MGSERGHTEGDEAVWMGPGWGRKLHRDLQRGELHKECLRDVQEMHPGFLKDVWRMQRRCTREAGGMAWDVPEDAQEMQKG